MSICRICYHAGSEHYPECPFSNIPPKKAGSIPLRQIDYWLDTKDGRRQTKKDFEAGKYRYLGKGIFEAVE